MIFFSLPFLKEAVRNYDENPKHPNRDIIILKYTIRFNTAFMPFEYMGINLTLKFQTHK